MVSGRVAPKSLRPSVIGSGDPCPVNDGMRWESRLVIKRTRTVRKGVKKASGEAI